MLDQITKIFKLFELPAYVVMVFNISEETAFIDSDMNGQSYVFSNLKEAIAHAQSIKAKDRPELSYNILKLIKTI